MDDNTVETIYTEDKQRRVRIEYDFDGGPADPREDAELVDIVTPNLRNWNVRTEDAQFQSQHDALYERGLGGAFPRYMKIFHDTNVVPVFMYEHSGVALSVGSFIGRAQHAEWDSGQIGWAYIRPDAEKWEGMDEREIIKSFVQTLGQWMNGEVYGWIVERKATGTKVYDDEVDEDEDFEEWVVEDSCWGYVGLEWAEQAAKTEGLGLPEEESK